MLAEAAFWRHDGARAHADKLVGRPELMHYVDAWPRPGDLGVIAEAEHPVGAAWLRFFSADDAGYGFVDADTPEIAMGVAPTWRGRGIGSGLLEALVSAARDAGTPSLSLSVEADNPARRLYERHGFVRVGDNDNSLTMSLRL